MGDIMVNTSRCSACGLCARFCPTGALTFLSDDERFALAFQPFLCLGNRCSICTMACPEQAVSLNPATISSDWLAKKSRYLAAGELTACQKCGESITAGPEHPVTCFVCRASADKMDSVQSVFGN
jgi:MinD superfamily P-loop ATPase